VVFVVVAGEQRLEPFALAVKHQHVVPLPLAVVGQREVAAVG
jgi:hypothetical protein